LTQTPAHILVVQAEDALAPDIARLAAATPATVETVDGDSLEAALHPSPSLVIVVAATSDELSHRVRTVKAFTRSPLMAVVLPDMVEATAAQTAVDDFTTVEACSTDLLARIQRLLRAHPDSGEIIRRGDLAINSATCEVSLGGRLIELTFKEYSLLKFLAGSPGRVFTREVLLSRVWGYDYYGGDRTVDVHVRRLRSKIEDANHTFIDTVRNIGYRFRSEGQ